MVETMAERLIAGLIAFASIIPLTILCLILVAFIGSLCKSILTFLYAVYECIVWRFEQRFKYKKEGIEDIMEEDDVLQMFGMRIRF